jgi:PAS domain S-box-containing protein
MERIGLNVPRTPPTVAVGSQASAFGTVLGWVGIGIAPVLCAAALRLSRELRRAEAHAAVSERRLGGVEETGYELVWEIDRNGIVTYMNGIARDMFGRDPADLVGKSVFVLLPPQELPRAKELFAQSVAERRGWTGLTFEALDSDGVLRWVETNGIAHLDGNGEVDTFIATTRRLDAEALAKMQSERIRGEIQQVLDLRTVMTVFQPIVDLAGGYVVGYEALSRFPREPVRPPNEWFDDAESVGLAVQLDLLCVETALRAAVSLPRDCYISINVMPPALQSGAVDALVQAAPLAADRIVIEITEHISVADYDVLLEPCKELRARGVRFAVDDAGSGYASFRHILRLQPDFIKLDLELIRDIDSDAAKRALAAAVVMFALEANAIVTAEGVETAAELAMVTTLGIDAAQGYLLGRPTDNPEQLRHARRRIWPGRTDRTG